MFVLLQIKLSIFLFLQKDSPEAAQKVAEFIERVKKFAAGESLPFTFILDDPAGNSFIQNPYVLFFSYKTRCVTEGGCKNKCTRSRAHARTHKYYHISMRKFTSFVLTICFLPPFFSSSFFSHAPKEDHDMQKTVYARSEQQDLALGIFVSFIFMPPLLCFFFCVRVLASVCGCACVFVHARARFKRASYYSRAKSAFPFILFQKIFLLNIFLIILLKHVLTIKFLSI